MYKDDNALWNKFWQDVAAGKAEDWEVFHCACQRWRSAENVLSTLYLHPRGYKIRRKHTMVTVTIPAPLQDVPESGEVWTFGWTGPLQPSFPKEVVAAGRGYATEEEAQMVSDAFRALVEGE
jgi:hypothetical protein